MFQEPGIKRGGRGKREEGMKRNNKKWEGKKKQKDNKGETVQETRRIE